MTEVEQVAQIVNDVIQRSDDFDCFYYSSTLRQKSQEENLGALIREMLSILSAVASYHFTYEDDTEPYGPMMQTREGRSPIPSDLPENDLARLNEVVAHITPSLLQARIFDVLWLRLRDLAHAESAINTFLYCADAVFDIEQWTHSAECAERALRLAALFRRKNPELAQQVADKWLAWLVENADIDKRFLTARAINLLLKFDYGDAEELLAYAKKIAQIAEADGDHHRSEEYWSLAVSAARKAKNSDEANSAQVALAETYVLNARAAQGAPMRAAHWMQQAVEAYKVVPNSRNRREELYTELLEVQKTSLGQLGKIEVPFDISEIITKTVQVIEGEELKDAIFKFAFVIACIPDYDRLAEQAEELARNHPLSHMFGSIHLDGEGKVIAKTPGSFGEFGKASSHEVYRLAQLAHLTTVMGCILPAADIIRAEHSLSLTDFESIAVNNPFVAPGQERMWAQGLYAGMKGDYEVALPILVPILENSLRHVLKQEGVRVSTLNTYGVQEEIRIGAILDHEVTLRILGHDSVMDLRGLLIERTYANLRNVISHGLGSVDTYYSPPAVYLWWLSFRLFITPFAKNIVKPENEEGQ